MMHQFSFFLVFLACVYAQTNIGPLKFTQISTPFQRPIAPAFHAPTNTLVVTSYYPNGNPHNFRRIKADGSQVQFSNIKFQTNEIKMAVVRRGNTNGFVEGDLFTGNGQDGQVQRVSGNNGQIQYASWCKLSTSRVGLIRGGLHVDIYNEDWQHNLLVVTTSGHCFMVESGNANCGKVTKIGYSGTHLEGITTTRKAAKYGALSGAILVGAEQQRRIYVFTKNGAAYKTAFYSVGCSIEDIDIIEEGQNFFGVNYGAGRLLGVDHTQWIGHGEKILLAQEGGALLFELIWKTNKPIAYRIPYASSGSVTPAGSWEQVTFAYAGVNEILPSDFTLCIDAKTTSGSPITKYLPVRFKTNAGAQTAISNYQYGSGTSKMNYPTTKKDTATIFIVQDYRNEFTLNIVFGKAGTNTGGKATITMKSSFLGDKTTILLRDDPTGDKYFFSRVGDNADGKFEFTFPAGQTDGLIIGPLDFVGAKALFDIELTFTDVAGITSYELIGSTSAAKDSPLTTYNLGDLSKANEKFNIYRVHCNCGNNKKDPLEDCDGEICCDNCKFSSPTKECRGKTTICDKAEQCTGNSATCPPDTFAPSTTSCATNGTQCAYCTGSSSVCPSGATNKACPTCNDLNNCTGNGVCVNNANGTLVCQCNTSPFGWTGTKCDIPICTGTGRTNCNGCSQHPGCGWCCKEKKCVPGSPSGPLAQFATQCDIFGFKFNPSQCLCGGACLNGGICDCGECTCVPPFGGPLCDQTKDCNGTLGGTATNDICGCNKGDTECIGCDGVVFGKKKDNCGVCGGDGTSCFKVCNHDNCKDCGNAGENCVWCRSSGKCLQKGHKEKCSKESEGPDDCGIFNLTTEEAVISGTVIALIIIAIVVGIILCIAGGGGGYAYYAKYKAPMGEVQSNPLYQEDKNQGNNPFYENENE